MNILVWNDSKLLKKRTKMFQIKLKVVILHRKTLTTMRVTAETTICVNIGETEFRKPIIFTIELPDGTSEEDIDQAVFDARKNSYIGTIDQEIVEIKE